MLHYFVLVSVVQLFDHIVISHLYLSLHLFWPLTFIIGQSLPGALINALRWYGLRFSCLLETLPASLARQQLGWGCLPNTRHMVASNCAGRPIRLKWHETGGWVGLSNNKLYSPCGTAVKLHRRDVQHYIKRQDTLSTLHLNDTCMELRLYTCVPKSCSGNRCPLCSLHSRSYR